MCFKAKEAVGEFLFEWGVHFFFFFFLDLVLIVFYKCVCVCASCVCVFEEKVNRWVCILLFFRWVRASEGVGFFFCYGSLRIYVRKFLQPFRVFFFVFGVRCVSNSFF